MRRAPPPHPSVSEGKAETTEETRRREGGIGREFPVNHLILVSLGGGGGVGWGGLF